MAKISWWRGASTRAALLYYIFISAILFEAARQCIVLFCRLRKAGFRAVVLDMSKLKAAFGNLDAGWVVLAISCDGKTIDIVASHIYDCFSPLTYALHKLFDEQSQVTVTLLGEPIEYDLRFVKADSNISLTIEEFPSRQRNQSQAKLLLSASGTYAEICLPFWRALRALQGRFSEEEIEARWRKPFPTRELNTLTETIKQ